MRVEEGRKCERDKESRKYIALKARERGDTYYLTPCLSYSQNVILRL